MSCILTSVLFEELDPVLGSMLIEDTAFIKSQIIFVGLGCGQVYCIPVVMESTVLPTPKILYSTIRPIKEIVCLKGLFLIFFFLKSHMWPVDASSIFIVRAEFYVIYFLDTLFTCIISFNLKHKNWKRKLLFSDSGGGLMWN